MSTKALTIHLTYIIIICTLAGMLYMQHVFFQSQAGISSDEQNKTQQKLAEITDKFETLQADFEALHKKKNATEQSLYYQDRLETLEVKHNALKVICEHHKAELDNCLSAQNQASGDTTSENNHPIQLLNERLKNRSQATEQLQTANELNQNEYDDPAQYASPETTKKEPQVKPKEPTFIELNPQSETIKPAPTEPQTQAEPVTTATEPTPSYKPESESQAKLVGSKQPPVETESKLEPEAVNSITTEPNETVKPMPIESAPESTTNSTNIFQCPSAETVNNHLATGYFTENNITWWLDFSFRPIHSKEEVKAAYKTMLSGKYMDCYYNIGPQESDDTINGIWIVIKGAAKNHTFLPSSAWEDCDIEECTKICKNKDVADCNFELEAQN